MLQTVTPSAPFQTRLQRFMPLRDTAMTSTQQEEFEMLLLKGTISANLPFTWIDSEFIQAAFALARSTAILRSRRSLSDQHSQDNQITSSPKTGGKTFEHVKEEIESIESQHKVPVTAVVSDAAGEAAKARHLLILWRPDILTLDCFSHQFNLPVGGKP
ncbi:hypothetical protein ABBQ38_008532 [Trebouxia sp. C0009 RCD-2024]